MDLCVDDSPPPIAIAAVVGNWHNVLQAINMASGMMGQPSHRKMWKALLADVIIMYS